jgi:serine/threonine-protein kinase
VLSGDSTEETRASVQRRLALFTKVWAVVIVAASIAVLGYYRLYPGREPPGRPIVHGTAALGVLVLSALWIAVYRGRRSLTQLYVIDALNLLVIGAVQGLSAYYSTATIPSAPWTAFIWQTFVVLSRVTIVPSTARRTAVVSALSYAPLVAAAIALAAAGTTPLGRAAFVALFAFLSTIAVVLATTSSQVIYGLRKQVRAATQLGPYAIERKIGEGAMGVVYQARHRLLRRPTAVKLLQTKRGSSKEAQVRFEREVQVLSQLTHPNTVAVYDYGHSEGDFYFAMEYLDGVNLERLIAGYGPQPAARVIYILVQVCGSLEEAHAKGLIHRDIKPANILLCRRGLLHDVVKVVDFGLVKDVTADAADASMIIAGTPRYIAPEAIADPGVAGPASDLYSLGATAYFLLTGKPVFDGRTPMDLYMQHTTVEPVPPSQRTDRPVPAALEALILRCLAKDPAARPAGAAELRRALAAMAEAPDWDEAKAAAWWVGVDVTAHAEVLPPISAQTLTIDVAERQPARTGHDTK